MQTQEEFFDSIADKWDGWERSDIGERVQRVATLAELEPGMRVLDVGTGTGVLIPFLREAVGPSGRIVAIDVSGGMLGVARAKGMERLAELRKKAIETIELPQASFDRVFCNAVFPHFEDKAAVLSKIFRFLVPGGRIVISHPIGREAVNAIHAGSDSVVSEDSVPEASVFHGLLLAAGFELPEVIDEPEFHLAMARKPRTPAPEPHQITSP